MPARWPPLAPEETLVFVPAQWFGDWEDGHSLEPAYQYIWRVSQQRLHPLPGSSIDVPYRPERLPESAISPRQIRNNRRSAHRKQK
jgi:hypothetical protein